MHFLGDVGTRVVDHHPVGTIHRRDSEPGIAAQRLDRGGEETGVEPEVDEARTGDLGRGDAVEIGGCDNRGRHLSG